jgi:hypothetical protein
VSEWVPSVCQHRGMATKDIEWTCCFCGEGVDETGLDPFVITIYDPGELSGPDRGSQHFYGHVTCLQERMHPTVAPYANALDPEWEYFIRQDEE